MFNNINVISKAFLMLVILFMTANALDQMNGSLITIQSLQVQNVDGNQIGVVIPTACPLAGFPNWRGYVLLNNETDRQIFSALQLAFLNNTPVIVIWKNDGPDFRIRTLNEGNSWDSEIGYKIRAVQ